MTIGIIGAHDNKLATVQILATFQTAQALNVKEVTHCRARILIAINWLLALVTHHILSTKEVFFSRQNLSKMQRIEFNNSHFSD